MRGGTHIMKLVSYKARQEVEITITRLCSFNFPIPYNLKKLRLKKALHIAKSVAMFVETIWPF